LRSPDLETVSGSRNGGRKLSKKSERYVETAWRESILSQTGEVRALSGVRGKLKREEQIESPSRGSAGERRMKQETASLTSFEGGGNERVRRRYRPRRSLMMKIKRVPLGIHGEGDGKASELLAKDRICRDFFGGERPIDLSG